MSFLAAISVASVVMLASVPPGLGADNGAPCAGLERGPRGTVTAVRDGDTVMLDSGEMIRLIGIQAPKLPLGRPDFEPWPLAGQAKSALEVLTLGQSVVLYYGPTRRDRHDRVLGHLVLADTGQWVQAEMIGAGMARVYSFPDNRVCLSQLLDMERDARLARRGLWHHPYYDLRDARHPDTLLPLEGRYELVEGRVLKAERVGRRVYLNFGRVWKDDFTVVIETAGLRQFEKSGLDPLAFADKVVRVRGWVNVLDGPRMEVTHPEQIELLTGRI